MAFPSLRGSGADEAIQSHEKDSGLPRSRWSLAMTEYFVIFYSGNKKAAFMQAAF